MKGSAAKWVGFAEAEAWDCKNWAAKELLWKEKVEASSNDADARELYVDSMEFCGRARNRFFCCGAASAEIVTERSFSGSDGSRLAI